MWYTKGDFIEMLDLIKEHTGELTNGMQALFDEAKRNIMSEKFDKARANLILFSKYGKNGNKSKIDKTKLLAKAMIARLGKKALEELHKPVSELQENAKDTELIKKLKSLNNEFQKQYRKDLSDCLVFSNEVVNAKLSNELMEKLDYNVSNVSAMVKSFFNESLSLYKRIRSLATTERKGKIIAEFIQEHNIEDPLENESTRQIMHRISRFVKRNYEEEKDINLKNVSSKEAKERAELFSPETDKVIKEFKDAEKEALQNIQKYIKSGSGLIQKIFMKQDPRETMKGIYILDYAQEISKKIYNMIIEQLGRKFYYVGNTAIDRYFRNMLNNTHKKAYKLIEMELSKKYTKDFIYGWFGDLAKPYSNIGYVPKHSYGYEAMERKQGIIGTAMTR